MPTPQLNITLVDTYSLDTIGFADISNYQGQVIKNVSFEISAPGFNKVNVFFTPQAVNIFNSADLGMGCDTVQIPDGLYTVKYSANNEFVEKVFYNISGLLVKFQENSLILQNCNCPPQKLPEITEIMLFINGAIASANQCDYVTANLKYNKASELIDRLRKCNC